MVTKTKKVEMKMSIRKMRRKTGKMRRRSWMRRKRSGFRKVGSRFPSVRNLDIILTCYLVEVDNGESNEVTLLTVRAKMFQMEKQADRPQGWKERGAGMLKVNVPKASVDLDVAGNPNPASFDASVLDEDDGSSTRQNVRLILRQDHTLRVILNTPILPTMSFKMDKKLKASFILFTALEGSEVKQVQLKVCCSFFCPV